MKRKKIIITVIITIILLLFSVKVLGIDGNSKDNEIVIAGGNTSERQILAEIVKQMIEHDMSDENVSIMNNIGSSVLMNQAMQKKDIDISGAMYTGTSLTGELEEEPNKNAIEVFNTVVKGYKDKFNMKWYPSYGFANTYAFMITRELAERENITKVSDLERLSSNLRAGVDNAWMERKGDGYADFKNLYGFDFKNVYPMEIGLVYSAVHSNEMEVVLGYSTDGRIDTYDLVLLEDDRDLFPPYDVSPVVNYEILDKYPQIDKILLKLENKISNKDMQKLNRKSDEELIEPKNIAKIFLEENNYFDDKEMK